MVRFGLSWGCDAGTRWRQRRCNTILLLLIGDRNAVRRSTLTATALLMTAVARSDAAPLRSCLYGSVYLAGSNTRQTLFCGLRAQLVEGTVQLHLSVASTKAQMRRASNSRVINNTATTSTVSLSLSHHRLAIS